MSGAQVERDGARWRLGTATDVAWIAAGTTIGRTITAAIPPVFAAYLTLNQPEDASDQGRHDAALLSVLRSATGPQPWWLGYLDTGADDVVFPAAARVSLYARWPYVLVEAGPDQAASWRRWEDAAFWPGHLPNLMFPADRSWLVSTLWDDTWTCVGGPKALADRLLGHPDLHQHGRRVELDADVTPPGRTMF